MTGPQARWAVGREWLRPYISGTRSAPVGNISNVAGWGVQQIDAKRTSSVATLR